MIPEQVLCSGVPQWNITMSNMTDDEIKDFWATRAASRIREAEISAYGRGRSYNYKALAEILNRGRKICTQCRVEKPLTEFNKLTSHPTGYMPSCRPCDAERTMTYRNQDRKSFQIRSRIAHYQRRYGMSLKEAASLACDPEGLCEICRKFTKLVVDHCHTTNKIRGKLCQQCNKLLGCAADNIDTILSAADYLTRNKDVTS